MPLTISLSKRFFTVLQGSLLSTSTFESQFHLITRFVEVPAFQPVQEFGGEGVSGYLGHRKLFHCCRRIARQRGSRSSVNTNSQHLKIPAVGGFQKEAGKFTVSENKVIRRFNMNFPSNRPFDNLRACDSCQAHKPRQLIRPHAASEQY